MLDTACLYRRVDADTFVRYAPSAVPGSDEEYVVVPADEVPPLALAAARVRLSQQEQRLKPGSDFRKAAILAMLQFQERAHAAGDPEAADPYLQVLSHLARNPDEQEKVQLSWIAQPTDRGKYGVKAVGVDDHAGQVLYGAKAQRALRGQNAGRTLTGRRAQEQFKGVRQEAPSRTPPTRIRDRARAVELLSRAPKLAGGLADHEIEELATHLPALTVHQLRKARVLLDAAWDGKRLDKTGMVKKLMEHVRGKVDSEMKAAGMVPEPVTPKPAEAAPTAPRPNMPPVPQFSKHVELEPGDRPEKAPGAPATVPLYDAAKDGDALRLVGEGVHASRGKAEDAARASNIPGAGVIKQPGGWMVAAPHEAKQPAPPAGQSILNDPKALAAAAHAAARRLPDVGGGAFDPNMPAHQRHRAAVEEVYDEMIRDGSLPKGTSFEDFGRAMVAAHQAGTLDMKRFDLPQTARPGYEHARNRIAHPIHGEFNYLSTPAGEPAKPSAVSATSPAMAGTPPGGAATGGWMPGGRRPDADAEERIRNLPEPTAGRLFADEEKPRTPEVKAAQDIADMARRRMPGLHIPTVPADAPLAEHLDALAAIDKHVRGLGVQSHYFGELADATQRTLDKLKNGEFDAEQAREEADEIGGGRTGNFHPDQIAEELHAAGHHDAALFFERQAHKAEQLAKTAILDAAGPEPAAEPEKPAAQTVPELEARMREEMSKPGADPQEAFNAALFDVPPEVRHDFFRKHNIDTDRGSAKGYYKAVAAAQEKFGAGAGAPTVHPAAEQYAQAMLKKEMERLNEKPPEMQERLRAQLTPEKIEQYLADRRAEAQKEIDDIGDKEKLYQMYRQGMFHPSNPNSRKLFEAATGTKLPAGAGATKDAIRAHLGEDFVAGKEREAAAKNEAEAQAKVEQKNAATAAEDEKYQGFGADMKPHQRARARAALDKEIRAGGEHTTVRDLVQKLVGEGRKISTAPAGERRLSDDNGNFYDEKQLGKTAMDYAEHLIRQGQGEKSLDNESQNDRISGAGASATEPTVTHGNEQQQLLEGAGGGTGTGGVPAGQSVGGDLRAGAAGVETGTGGGTRPGPDVLRPGQGGAGTEAVRGVNGEGNAPRNGAGTGDERPVKPRLKRKFGGPPRAENGTRLGGGLDGKEPALPDPTPAEQVVSEPPEPENPTDVSAGNFRYTDRDFYKGGGQKAKFNANLAAIRTLRQIEADGRATATPEEQAILSKFTGWGQFPALFNDFYDKDFRAAMEKRGINWHEFENERKTWDEERETLKSLLSPEEWKAAQGSTLNAHYTHPDVVDAHWRIAKRLGFTGGRYLETSAGVGYYLGLMPPDLAAKTRTSAVELDPTTGSILKTLYPATHVEIKGFEKHRAPDNFYDLIASNVPFGDYAVHDPKYNKHQANIHDYFFLKSADKVRPGGLVMHITSKGTLDKGSDHIRRELYKTCDLVGAIRFPGDAHKESAGTKVVTDMLILRKRLPGEPPGDASWLKTETVPDPAGGEPIPVNSYFVKNPHMVLGTIDRTGTLYGGKQPNVSKTADYDDRLEKAIGALPVGVFNPFRAPKARFEPEALPAPDDVKNGGYAVKDGKVYVREGDALVQKDHNAKDAEKIGAHLKVLGAVRALLKAETAGEDATPERAELNKVYDAFVKKHGFLNAPANKRLFAAPDDAPVLHALENYDPKTKKATKTEIFSRPVVSPVKSVDKVGTVAEGVGVSLHETAGIDVDRIAKLTGKPRKAVERELVEQGLAYESPSHGWQPADQYLSGNVRQKLADARAAAAADPRYAPNVAALEKVQPADLHHDEIDPKLGAVWIPPSDVAQFAAELLKTSPEAFEITRVPHTNDWHAEWASGYHGKLARNSKAATDIWGVRSEGGTVHAHAMDLLKSALTGAPMVIRTRVPGDENPVVNRELTDAANVKVQQLKDEFKNWLWVDPERRERLHRFYNDNFNNIKPINYDGSHLKFPGMTPSFQLRPHQKNFVWQVITTGNGLAAHEVGTGKTATMIASAMELRRLGLAKKPAIACLKANAEAIAADARRLYPGAKIVSLAGVQNAKDRKTAMARIATGDYDMIVMTHDQLDRLGMRPETQVKYLEEEKAELAAAHAAALQEDKEGRAGKELGKALKNFEAKLQAALKAESKDDAIHFEDLGIDHLFVDEAHAYKTLPAYSKRRGLKGINNGRSDRASSMLMRTRWIKEQNGGRGVVFATGTPITNTVGELFVMQKYLQPEELKARGIDTFDAWAATFADQETKQEKTTTGEFKDVTRLSSYSNVNQLKAIAGLMLDSQRADDLKDRFPFDTEAEARAHAVELYKKNPYAIQKPNPTDDDLKNVGIDVTKTDDGKYEAAAPIVSRPRRNDVLHALPPTEMTGRMMKELQARAKALKGRAEKGADNMLSISTDGRKGAIDARMLYPDAPDDPDSKANKLIENVLAIHKKNPDKTQMIFSDIGVNPTKTKGPTDSDTAIEQADEGDSTTETQADLGSRTGFRLYDDIISKLVKGGIPREKIADFSQLEGKKKEEAIDKLKTGEFLVALGSTKKLGTGVNAQDKLIAMHHLDAPWVPASLEQRDGRGWRNGNENKEVQVHKYVTERSLDDYFWGVLARKDRMIKQMLSRKAGPNTLIEEDSEELTPDQIMAAASGDPRILEKVQLEDDVRKLTGAAKRHSREQYEYSKQLRAADSREADIQKQIEGYKEAVAHLEAHPDFELKLNHGPSFTDRKEGAAAAAFEDAVKKAGGYDSTIGHYRGLRIVKNSGNVYLETPTGQREWTNGSLASLEARARNLDGQVQAQELALEKHRKDVETLSANAGKPFPKAEELAKKEARLKELHTALAESNKKDEETSPAT